jgi:hypothetical protein
MQWVLGLAMFLWKFKSQSGLQLLKWEFIWECGGSFPHTIVHYQEHEMWFPGFPLGPHPCKPLLWLRSQGLGCNNLCVLENFWFVIGIPRFLMPNLNAWELVNLDGWMLGENEKFGVWECTIWIGIGVEMLEFDLVK